MNKQIKVKESPKDGLVLDYGVPSGPADFMTSKVLHKKVKEPCRDCQDCLDDMKNTGEFSGSDDCKHKKEKIHSYNKKIGTKHIQLIDVNTDIEGFGEGPSLECYFIDRDGYEIYKGADAYYASGCKQNGEDFFIYKISKEKICDI